MDAMVDALQGAAAGPEAGVQPVPVQRDDGAIEIQLAQEISTLWTEHVRLSASRKTNTKELRQIRAKLAERLYAIKQLLCRVGRSGQWRSWLKERQIPRSSADRLCERHAETLGIRNQNASDGAIKEEQDTVEKMVQSLLPRLRSKLPDARALFRFIAALAEAFGLASVDSEDCIWVYEPGPEEDEDSSALDAPEAASAERTVSPGTGAPSRNAVAP